RSGAELVNEAAGGDDEDRGEERDLGGTDRTRRRPRAGCGRVGRRITHPWTAAATIRPIAMHIEPTTIASARFFFSTISSHRWYGVSLSTRMNAIQKTSTPISA